jgi:beta-galactosidase
MLKKDIFINFEGVDSCFYLYVNGQFAAYSQVSHMTSEVNITKYLCEGENNIKVLVFKWCDGTYLEDQDKSRYSGIFREVYLLARDKKHIKDVYIRTALSDSFDKATLTLDLTADDLDYAYTLMAPNGDVVAAGNANTAKDTVIEIDAPVLWNDETPLLYTLLISSGSEVIPFFVGLKDIKVVKGVCRLCGYLSRPGKRVFLCPKITDFACLTYENFKVNFYDKKNPYIRLYTCQIMVYNIK